MCLLGCAGSGTGAAVGVIGPIVELEPRRFEGRGFAVPGEKMTYDVRLRGISVGRMRIVVGEIGEIDGRQAIIVRSLVDSAGVLAIVRDLSWELSSTLDLERGYALVERSIYAAHVAGRDEADDRQRDYSLTGTTHNLHSLVAMIRGWSPEQGEQVFCKVRIAGRFSINLRAGPRRYSRDFRQPTLRLEGRAQVGGERAFTIDVTDDAARVPLRVDVETNLGRLSVVLVRYHSQRWQWPPPRQLRGVVGP
jgi:hypothetical protein